MSVKDLSQSVESLKGANWVDPDDPNVVAEKGKASSLTAWSVVWCEVTAWQRLLLGTGWLSAKLGCWHSLIVGNAWLSAKLGCWLSLIVGNAWLLAKLGCWQSLVVGKAWLLAKFGY